MIINKEYVKSAKALGLSTKEINSILDGVSDSTEQSSFSLGPPDYAGGTRYGTISIKVFKTLFKN